MKLSSFRTFLAFVCSIGLISYVVAGPGASGDHGKGAGSDPGLTRTTIPASRDNPRAKAVNSIRKTIPGKAEARGDGTRRKMVLPTEVRIRIQTRLIVAKRRSIPAIAASVKASPPKE